MLNLSILSIRLSIGSRFAGEATVRVRKVG
jgi:hypothetical protein